MPHYSSASDQGGQASGGKSTPWTLTEYKTHAKGAAGVGVAASIMSVILAIKDPQCYLMGRGPIQLLLLNPAMWVSAAVVAGGFTSYYGNKITKSSEVQEKDKKWGYAAMIGGVIPLCTALYFAIRAFKGI